MLPSLVRMLLYLLVVAAFMSEFRNIVEHIGPAGKLIKLVPDGLSGLLLIVGALELGRRRVLYVPPRYLAVGLLLVLHMAVGCLVNTVPPDTVVAGVRNFFKFIPLFLLPAIIPLDDREIRRLLLLTLVLMLVQVPISVLQRLLIDDLSGDVVRGTMSSGAIMSIALLSTIGVLFAFYLRGRLGRGRLIVLVSLLFLPTMINETKGTVILLPIALLAVAAFHDDPGRRLRRVTGILGVCLLMLGIFASVFDYMYPTREGGIVEFFLEGGATANVYKQKDIGEGKDVGRVDSVIFAYDELRKDPVKLVVGLGIGNVSDSLISGEYAEDYKDYGVQVTTFSALLWEVGLLGIALSLVLLAFMARDAASLRADEGVAGALGLGWVAVCVVVLVSMMYKDLVHQNVIGYLFMLISGVVVSRAVRLGEVATRVPPLQRDSRAAVPGTLKGPLPARHS